MLRRGCWALLLAGCAVETPKPAAIGHAESAVTWTTVTAQGAPRSGHAALLLASGRVLVSGGLLDTGGRNSATVFDPKTNTWAATKDMAGPHALHCMLKLASGAPMAIGGIAATSADVSSVAEIFDEASNTWTAKGSLATARRRAACALLPSGKVLVAGGETGDMTAFSTTEIYDPTSGTFSAGPAMSAARGAPVSISLDDGRVLVLSTGTGEIYDATAGAWHPVPGSGYPQGGALVKLPSGKFLLVGYGGSGSMLFDPKSETFTPAGALTKKRAGMSATLLTNGQVLAVGGVLPPSSILGAVELFDPATNTWTATDPLGAARFEHSATLLQDGRVLVVGGASTTTLPAPEVFNAPNGAACTTGDTCGSGHCTDGRCCNQACDGACVACDVKGKEGTCSPISGAPHEEHASCTPFAACVEGACASTCASDADCAKGNICYPPTKTCAPEKGLCDGDHTVVDLKSGLRHDCSPFACTPSGDCLDKCTVSSDCSVGMICGENAMCVAPPAPETPDKSGCSYGRAEGSAFGLLSLALLLVLRRRKLLLASLLVSCAPASESLGHDDQALTYAGAGVMAYPARIYHTAAALGDGRVLVVGTAGGKGVRATEVFDPSTSTWKTMAPAAIDRVEATATTLTDGRVLVVGGTTTKANAEIFDPATNAYVPAGTPAQPRRAHAAILLADGRVLVVGGMDKSMFATAEIYDPASNAWSATGSMKTGRAYSAIARLVDGRVLVAGGLGLSSTEIWDPASNAFSPGPSLAASRDTFEAVTLADGRVILAGGQDKTILAFDGGAFSTVGAFDEVRVAARSTLLLDGRVLFSGGLDASETQPLANVTLFDPKTNKATPFAPLPSARGYHTATLLKSGRVLLVGGIATYNEMDPVFANAEVLNLFDGQPCGKGEECASGACVDGVCCASSCSEACSACNVAGHEGTCSPIAGKPREGHATCAPFDQCVAGGCVTVCASDLDCDDAHVCDDSHRCVDPKATCNESVVTDNASGLTRDCSPYRCISKGSCLQRCTTSDDCVSASACDQGVCRALPPEDKGGCAFSGFSGPARSSAAFVSLALLALAVSRRRR